LSSLPTWAVWLIVVPLVLRSPVIAFLLAIAVEMLAWGMVDTGVPRLVLVGGSAAGLVLFRRLRARSRHAASGEA
jgi:hypothetical protein